MGRKLSADFYANLPDWANVNQFDVSNVA